MHIILGYDSWNVFVKIFVHLPGEKSFRPLHLWILFISGVRVRKTLRIRRCIEINNSCARQPPKAQSVHRPKKTQPKWNSKTNTFTGLPEPIHGQSPKSFCLTAKSGPGLSPLSERAQRHILTHAQTRIREPIHVLPHEQWNTAGNWI